MMLKQPLPKQLATVFSALLQMAKKKDDPESLKLVQAKIAALVTGHISVAEFLDSLEVPLALPTAGAEARKRFETLLADSLAAMHDGKVSPYGHVTICTSK